MLRIAVVLEPCEEGGYTASVPTIPGCVSEGDTEQEAMKNIVEAIELLLEPVDEDLASVAKDARVKELLWDLVPGTGKTDFIAEKAGQNQRRSESSIYS